MEITFTEEVGKLFGVKPAASLLALVLLGLIMLAVSKRSRFDARIIAYGALAIATSFVLSYFKLFQLPVGGSVTLASMLPLFIFSYIAGPWVGMAAGLVYGLLQFIQEPYFFHWAQFLLDYPIAFALLGLAGFFKNNLYLGAVAGSVCRLAVHFLSGVIFFAANTPPGQNVYLFSLLYNLSYILPDLVLCLAVLLLPGVNRMVDRLKRNFPLMAVHH